MCSDHPSNTRLKTTYLLLDMIISVLLQKVLLVRLNWGKNQYFSNCNYRSPSETPDQSENYFQNIDLILLGIDDTSSFFLRVIGDFNARCKNWWTGDENSNTGKELGSLTSTAGNTQLIDKSTYFFSDGS